MKTILIIIIIYLFALKTRTAEIVVLIKDNHKANILISDSLLMCQSYIGLKEKKWNHWHKIKLDGDLTNYGFAPVNGMRVEISVYKYN